MHFSRILKASIKRTRNSGWVTNLSSSEARGNTVKTNDIVKDNLGAYNYLVSDILVQAIQRGEVQQQSQLMTALAVGVDLNIVITETRTNTCSRAVIANRSNYRPKRRLERMALAKIASLLFMH